MKKANKRIIVVLIVLLISLIAIIKFFTDSKANETIPITAIVVDSKGINQNEEYIIQATNEGDSGYSIVLPEIIGDNLIEKYIVEIKEIENTEPNENNVNNDTNTVTEGAEDITENSTDTANTAISENSGSVEESEKQENSDSAKDVTILENNATIEENNNSVEDNIVPENNNSEEGTTTIPENDNLGENTPISENNTSSEDATKPDDNNTTSDNNTETLEKFPGDKIYLTAEELEKKEIVLNVVYGDSIELLALDDELALAEIASLALLNTDAVWDGSTATGFYFGDGSINAPYLICTGAELSYLATQVNNGNSYEGKYFQLASDINLGERNWTPIGNSENSFKGVFDGAGHVIANANIVISTWSNTSVTSYGIFGSIGNGSSTTIIRNVIFEGITVNITTARTTTTNNTTAKGYHIGVVAGTMYNKSQIENCIVKNSNVEDANTITLRNYSSQVSVGGIVGYVTNTYYDNADPGIDNRCSIKNCFSDTDIDLSIAAYRPILSTDRTSVGGFHSGGIVGTIRGQAIWPENCLYNGTITAAGLVGPIFGGVMINTTPSNMDNMSTVWTGNSATDLTMTSYYSSYNANGTNFTRSVTTSSDAVARVSSSTNNIGYVQGVNKGIYSNNMTTMLNMFNSNVTDDNRYLTWKYENNTFSFNKGLVTEIDENNYVYTVRIVESSNEGNYSYTWYIDGEKNTSLTGNSYAWTPTFKKDEEVLVVTSNGRYFSINEIFIEKLKIEIAFDVNEPASSVTASLIGNGINYVSMSDYTYQWYKVDIPGDEEIIENATNLTLSDLVSGYEYKLVATNNVEPNASAENSFIFKDRIVVFVDYTNGNNSRDGFTPETAVQNLSTAYSKLSNTGTRNNNVIVMMGNYNNNTNSYFDSPTSTTYAKNATITGKYAKVDYNANWTFGSITRSYYFRYLTADLTIMHLTLNGNNGQMYLICQGHNITIDEQVTMNNYATSNSNQGLLGGNAPAFHLFAGWYQYNRTTLPNNDCEVVIKSGTYGRVILGGTPGTSSGQGQSTSHDFMGSENDKFRVSLVIDIKNSTTAFGYDYDVNLLAGGSASGNNYSIVNEEIIEGKVGRVLGGSIGDSASRPNNWNYPENTFLGETTINIKGGTIAELYGGCLGRNMNVVGNANSTGNLCDSYFYGKININIENGLVTGNIYGAGAGGVTGYNENSSDTYKSYGRSYETEVNINISGGTVQGNVFGGGYGYTEYLNRNVTTADGGTLYGDSNITITGNPTIQGNIYAAGFGYNYTGKEELAQMLGNSTINVSGTPTINGQIYGAGAGISGHDEMAKLIGTSTININTDLTKEVFGGGNIAKLEGTSTININSGTHRGTIYGGGNVGIVDGTTHVYINGGTQEKVFGGGNQAKATTTNVYINEGNTTEVYGGGNLADATTTNVYLQGGNVTSGIYGGSNQSGTINTSNIITTSGTTNSIFGGNNLGGITQTSNVTTDGGTIQSVYGGNNQGGTTNQTIVNIKNGNIVDAYGGGNQAPVINSNITISGKLLGNAYGGGNQAEVTNSNIKVTGEILGETFGGGNQAGIGTDAHLTLSGAKLHGNAYGGGNEGTVTGNTYVNVTDTTSYSSIYAGGNGPSAVVYGNVNITLDGRLNNIDKNIFGGGNKAPTGTEDDNNSISTVNIVGGTIKGNVYGGANTSVIHGITKTNIGYDAVGNTDLVKGDIIIKGTVFGGGEANESGSENYDFSYISVTEGIDIQIDGNGYDVFSIEGSIFGSGNASSTTGESYITIKNYGTFDNPKSNVSLQRANCATIINSAFSLSGAADRTNEFFSTLFSISRVDKVKLENNSTLFLDNGANLLMDFESLLVEDGNEIKAAVNIDKTTGNITKNVDNRIYMLEGKNLNIATNQAATTYGKVYGMTFLGIYANKNNPSASTGLYHKSYNQGDVITSTGMFSSNSYVKAQHMVDHNTEEDGFYTNYNKNETISVDYIGVTPEDDVYYIWLAGEDLDITIFEIELIASKYATFGTKELSLMGFSNPNIKFILSGISSGLESDVSFVNPDEINQIEDDEGRANSIYGLTMTTGNSGWQTKGSTTFLLEANEVAGSYTGNSRIDADNSSFTPTLNFCLYHAANISSERDLGTLRIRYQVLTPIDELNDKVSWIDINVILSSNLYQNYFYEAAITPGEKFGLFTTTDTTITNKSQFSAYYSLFIDDFLDSDYYQDFENYRRVLISRDSNNQPCTLPQNTKIVMLDMVTNQYYYYIVSKSDVDTNKYIFELSDFIVMDSLDKKYDEKNVLKDYYVQDQNLEYENFIFHLNFDDAKLDTDIINNNLLFELRDENDEILLGVLGIERDTMNYTVYRDKEAVILADASLSKESIYLKQNVYLNVTTDFTQSVVDSKTIYDTQYFDKKLGVKISIYDNEGTLLTNSSLLGVYFELDGEKYYPRFDGTTRICISDKVTDVLARIRLNTINNSTLATGDYTIKVEAFGSSDGIYYGLEASGKTEVKLRIINVSYGLKVTTEDTAKIIDRATGKMLNNNNSLVVKVDYEAELSNPMIAFSLYRRDYTGVYSNQYTKVNLADYVTNSLSPTGRENEYIVSRNPLKTMTQFYTIKSDLPATGTYKLVYTLYDENSYVGEVYEYIIIK